MALNSFSSKNSNEARAMYSTSDSIEILIGSEMDEIIEDLYDSFLQRYQKGLEEPLKGSGFIFDNVDLLYYKFRKISLVRVGLYKDSPEWLKNEKATTNPKNNDDKYFQYSRAAALNLEQIKSHPERTSNIKSFINQYNWKETDFPSHKNDWKKFQKNNKTIALNILYVLYNSEEIITAYVSENNLKHKKPSNSFDDYWWLQMALSYCKKLYVLLNEIILSHDGDFYCLNCFHSFRTKNKLKKH